MPDGVFKYQTGGGARWGVRLKFKDADDIWRAKTWRGFTTLRDARTFCDTKRADRYRDKFFPGTPTEQTVRDYFKHWLASYAAPSCKYSTYTSYVQVINRYLLPEFGHLPLGALSTAHLKTILSALAGRRRQTVRNIFTPIREALSHAVSEGLLPVNPATALAQHLRRLREVREPIHPFGPADTLRLLAVARKSDPALSVAVHLGVRAGLRAGEVLGLRWDTVNLHTQTAVIRHARVRERETIPKNGHPRTVHLTESVTRALKRCPAHPDTPLVVHHQGTACSHKWLIYHYHQLLKTANLPRQRFHDLRHAYATQLIALGANIKYIQNQLGHHTIAMTLNTYGHLFPEIRLADQLEQQL